VIVVIVPSVIVPSVVLAAAIVMALVSGMILVIFMIPVALMHLPALLVVIVMGMVPIGPFVWRSVPAPCYPPIMMPVRRPIPLDPGISWTRFRSTLFVAQGRWCASDVYRKLRRSRDGDSRGE
jgi:hypothetical protein